MTSAQAIASDTRRSLSQPLQTLLESTAPRADSLIITVFGDAIEPYGGSIWLGKLISLMAPFGLSERQVRTGVYRLSQENWLSTHAKGRKSCYSVAAEGKSRFAEAERKIYQTTQNANSSPWTLVHILPEMAQTDRQTLRRQLRWLGFGQFSPNLMAHPNDSPDGLEGVIDVSNIKNKTIVFQAEITKGRFEPALKHQASTAWELDTLNADYQRFEKLFQNFCTFAGPSLDAFVLRILLIHEFRRVLLKDPQLPVEALPENWAAGRAQKLCAEVYRAVHENAGLFLLEVMCDNGISANPLIDSYWQRFGRL